MLHRTRLLAVGLMFGAGCTGSTDANTGDCALRHETKTITTTEPAEDPGLQFKIESCRVDVDACPTLCALAMTRAGLQFNNGGTLVGAQPNGGGDLQPLPPGFPVAPPVNPTIACDVMFQAGNVDMTVKYDVYESTLGCPVQVQNDLGAPPTPVPTGGPK